MSTMKAKMGPSIAMYSSLNSNEALPEEVSLRKPKRRKRGFVRKSLATFWHNTTTDLKSISWGGLPSIFFRDFFPVLCILGLIGSIAIMATRRQLTFPRAICRPDGTVSDGNSTYNPWKSSETFTINVSFGKLKLVSFGTAKLVDAISDIILGRGGQGILAVVSYTVSARTLSRLMEKRPVSYGVFEAVTLQKDSVTSFAKLIRDLPRNEGARTKFTIIWLLYSAASLLVYPTLASAMTGYSANMNAQVMLPNGTRVSAPSFQTAYYIIHDASRLGSEFYDDYAVVDHHSGDPSVPVNSYCYVSSADELDECRHIIMSDCATYAPAHFDKKSKSVVLAWKSDVEKRPDCALLWDVSQYASTYGFGGTNKTSIFNNTASSKTIFLPSPSLNISTFSHSDIYTGSLFSKTYNDTELAWGLLPYAYIGNGSQHTSDMASNHLITLLETYALKDTEARSDRFMNLQSIIRNASCQQQAQDSLNQTPIQYRWGFSYQLLLSCLILILVWSIGTYAMHMDSFMNSSSSMEKRDMGLRRAILDIAPKYEQRLEGQETDLESDKKLKQLIGNKTISYKGLIECDVNATRQERVKAWWKAFSFKVWFRQEWKLLLLLLVITVLYVLSWAFLDSFFVFWDPLSGMIPWFGVVIVLIIGKKHASRWIVLALFFVLYIVVHSWIVVAYFSY